MRLTWSIVALAIGTLPGRAQTRFEVASIKQLAPDPRGMIGGNIEPAGFSGDFLTIKTYIQIAFNLRWEAIVGPAWLNADAPTYSIRAKAPGPASKDQIRAMLQSLLAERFGLQAHKEQREGPVYVLIVKKSEPKIRSVDYEKGDADLCVHPTPGGLEARHCSMAAFARGLAGGLIALGRPVVDATGLPGRYE